MRLYKRIRCGVEIELGLAFWCGWSMRWSIILTLTLNHMLYLSDMTGEFKADYISPNDSYVSKLHSTGFPRFVLLAKIQTGVDQATLIKQTSAFTRVEQNLVQNPNQSKLFRFSLNRTYQLHANLNQANEVHSNYSRSKWAMAIHQIQVQRKAQIHFQYHKFSAKI